MIFVATHAGQMLSMDLWNIYKIYNPREAMRKGVRSVLVGSVALLPHKRIPNIKLVYVVKARAKTLLT